MNAKRLSDDQLYALVMNKDLDEKISQIVHEEYLSRNFDFKKLDELSLHFESKNIVKEKAKLSSLDIFLIFINPFASLFHNIYSSRHLKANKFGNWNLYWKLITISSVLWTFGFFAFVYFF